MFTKILRTRERINVVAVLFTLSVHFPSQVLYAFYGFCLGRLFSPKRNSRFCSSPLLQARFKRKSYLRFDRTLGNLRFSLLHNLL